jgi:hypothetical protein
MVAAKRHIHHAYDEYSLSKAQFAVTRPKRTQCRNGASLAGAMPARKEEKWIKLFFRCRPSAKISAIILKKAASRNFFTDIRPSHSFQSD